MTPKSTLASQLKALALRIKAELQANISAVQQETRIFISSKILDFEYTKEGARFSKTQYEYITQRFCKLSQAIIDSVKNTLEYNIILRPADDKGNSIDANSLDRFVEVIADCLLNKTDSIEETIDTIIVSFVKDIYQEPFKFSATVELVGVVIEPESIELNQEVFRVDLRQVNIDDLQKKQLIYPYLVTAHASPRRLLIPSSIINIESYGTKPYEIQHEIQKIITVLRLFKVSSVDYISYSMESEAVLWERRIDGIISSIKDLQVLEKLRVTKENASDLVSFYKAIKGIIPKGIYSDTQEKDMLHLTIAYRHYSEALLSKIRIEEKITNTVIGLESLLLAENQEISFRFWVRGAKILGLLGYSPLIAKNRLKVAYGIRSTFVHGDDLELDKKLKKLNEHQQETNAFLIELLDYLRTLIVVMIFLSANRNFVRNNKDTKNFDKKKFLDIVDDSLISVEKENQLKELLSYKAGIL